MDPKVYKEVLTHHRRGTNGGGEPRPRWCLDLFLMDTEPCGGGTSNLGLFWGVLEYLGIYRVKRRCGRSSRWAQPTWVRLGPQVRPGWLCPPRGTPRCCSGPSWVFWSIKNLQKVSLGWTPFDIDFPHCKKQAKNSNWHWALGQ